MYIQASSDDTIQLNRQTKLIAYATAPGAVAVGGSGMQADFDVIRMPYHYYIHRYWLAGTFPNLHPVVGCAGRTLITDHRLTV